MKNYYQVLKIVNFAEEEVIRASYKALAKKYHPDVNKEVDPKILVEINQAYEVLSDKSLKEKYDNELKLFLLNTDQKEIINRMERSDYYNKGYKESNNKNKRIVKYIRLIISIIVGSIIALLGNSIVFFLLSGEGTWGFILYTIFSYILGVLANKISNSDSEYFAICMSIVMIITMILPYCCYYYESLLVYYNQISFFELAIQSLGLTIDYLVCSGVIRMFFIILAPIVTYQTIND